MRIKKKEGFTLIELLVSIGILIIITPIVYTTLVDFSRKIYLDDIKIKSLTNTVIVNNMISGIVTNSYGINYGETDIGGELDKISLYTDKLEKNTLSIFIKQELDKDISRIYIKKNGNEYPLHSTDLFIKSFNIKHSPRPIGAYEDIQPWVSINIIARTRSPLEEPTDDTYYDMYNKSEANLYGRWIIRNYVPSSGKN